MKIEVSVGELVDKVSILEIKIEKIKDAVKSGNVKKEYDVLINSMNSAGVNKDTAEYKELKKINSDLWEIEDRIRIKEKREEFDSEFIELARSVYFNNDKRSEVKRRINIKMNSGLIEEKEYVDYKSK